MNFKQEKKQFVQVQLLQLVKFFIVCTQFFIAWVKLYWPLIILVLLFGNFYVTYINLFNSDIGRHLVNGKEILSGSWEILYTNYYSFTQTNFATINHHWLFGVIVFLLHKIGGFDLLTWFNWLLNTAAFILILSTALFEIKKLKKQNFNTISLGIDKKLQSNNVKKIGIFLVTFLGFFTMPLITHRDEVRPESISLFFFSVYYFVFSILLTKVPVVSLRKNLVEHWWLFALLFGIQIIWANSHLFFILGPLLAGYFLFETVVTIFFEKRKNIKINSVKNTTIQLWLFLFLGLFAISYLNPNRLTGLLAPLSIFDNYAYRVAENQSTFFMISYGSNTTLFSYIIVWSCFILLFFLFTFKDKTIPIREKLPQLILLGIFVYLANKVNRMSPFLAVLIIPIVAKNSFEMVNSIYQKYEKKLQSSVVLMCISFISFLLLIGIFRLHIFIPPIARIGTGIFPGTNIPAQFFIENNLHGPVFNNYDIGGYLAYNLFPAEKLFIDNRPEAYANSFLQQEYLAALQDETVWKHISEKYQLNVIFFLRHDQIDGAQEFLYKRVTDPAWVSVYVDDVVLILVKNTEQNKKIIEKYTLPTELFVMKDTSK